MNIKVNLVTRQIVQTYKILDDAQPHGTILCIRARDAEEALERYIDFRERHDCVHGNLTIIHKGESFSS